MKSIQDGILCLAVSNNGSLLASGGKRELHGENKVQLRKPSQTRNARDPVTCAQWLTLKDEGDNILCCGTGLGYLFLWKQNSTLATRQANPALDSGHTIYIIKYFQC